MTQLSRQDQSLPETQQHMYLQDLSLPEMSQQDHPHDVQSALVEAWE